MRRRLRPTQRRGIWSFRLTAPFGWRVRPPAAVHRGVCQEPALAPLILNASQSPATLITNHLANARDLSAHVGLASRSRRPDGRAKPRRGDPAESPWL